MSNYFSGWKLIINPVSGTNRNLDKNLLIKLLKESGFDFETSFTERPKHAIELVQEALSKGIKKFIVSGGDGTYNEVINGIFGQNVVDPSETVMAMIPGGTGNDLVKTIGLPKNLKKAVEVLAKGNYILQDVGKVSYFDKDIQDENYFLNVAGTGFDAYVAEKYFSGDAKKGKLTYFLSIFKGLWSYKNHLVNITLNGQNIQTKIFLLAVGNCRYYGNGMKVCPNAVPTDGMLDLTLAKDLGKWDVIKLVRKIFSGKFQDHPKVDLLRSSEVRVESKQPIYLQADGELLGHTPFEFSVLPKQLKIVVGSVLNWEPREATHNLA